MKEIIKSLIHVIRTGIYDEEVIHKEYDECLERFILNYDPELLPLMRQLIGLEKDFFYA